MCIGLLAENQLVFSQTLEIREGHGTIVTTLEHVSGEKLSSRSDLQLDPGGRFGGRLEVTAFHSAIAMLGLCPPNDDPEKPFVLVRERD